MSQPWSLQKHNRHSTLVYIHEQCICTQFLRKVSSLLLVLLSFYLSPRSPLKSFSNESINLPPAYDFIQEFPFCDFGPLDQECGCCYAYGVIKSMSHRFCRALGHHILLSSQYVVACDLADNACVGGCERSVLYTMEVEGITDKNCHPWEHRTFYDNTFCSKCSNSSSQYKLYKSVYGSVSHYSTIDDIKKAIYLEGPVSASIAVDNRFSTYSGGIYTSTLTGPIEAGNHAVEIIGWGIENETEYWIVLNQYGSRWGENGRIRIKLGTNEGLIESFVYGATPLIE